MQLIDDHLGKIGRDEILVVPGKARARADGGKAVRETVRIEFARAGVALIAARSLALDPEPIAIAVAGSALKAGPVAALVLPQQPVVGGLIVCQLSEHAVQVDRLGLRRPDLERRAAGLQRRADRRL